MRKSNISFVKLNICNKYIIKIYSRTYSLLGTLVEISVYATIMLIFYNITNKISIRYKETSQCTNIGSFSSILLSILKEPL